MKIIKVSQDFGGYYSGAIPDYEGSLIGSPSVEISNVASQFGDAQKSVDLVNRFDSDLLKNIVYMFNFAKSGVYGVYVPALDKAVKTKELQKRLESMGYDVVDENGMLQAYPTQQEKSQEQVQSEIQQVYNDLESKGGSVLGLNVADTRKETEGSFNNLQHLVDPSMHDQLKNDLMIAHMAATMAHEATHAHGHEDEGMPTQVETALLNSAIKEIQQKYGIEGELGLSQGSNNNWYRTAQAHFPLYGPSGSDLNGRHGDWDRNLQGQPSWGMMNQQYQNMAIEQMLGRQFQSAIPYDLNQEADSYELQLRKFTRDDWKPNPHLVYEELLSESRDIDDSSYRVLEELLNDLRPQPLMKPIKEASKLTKVATLFGWMNNLEISDGSTIPGLGDRVMAWDDRDESFAEYEGWIKAQPRYNPTYDLKGFYYRWIEPRFKPTPWSDIAEDGTNTSPAKRFAQKTDLGFVVDSLRQIRSAIKSGKIKATRLICTEDILSVIDKAMGNSGIDVDIFEVGDIKGEEVYACWIHKGKSEEVQEAERAIFNNDEQLRDIMQKILGKPSLCSSVKEIMDKAKNICQEYDIDDVYAIGSYAREIFLGDSTPEVEELEFSSNNTSKCLKFGYLLANSLNIDPIYENKNLHFIYKGIPVTFNGGNTIPTVQEWMSSRELEESDLLHDLCNKDFTLNSKTYNLFSGIVSSAFGDDKEIKTIFDPSEIVEKNPLVILRAIYLALRHNLPINNLLEKEIIRNLPQLKERVSPEVLEFGKEKIKNLGEEEAIHLFKKYGLHKILGV